MTWFSKRRKEKAARLHLSAVADRIGARVGTVLKEESIGGLGLMSAPIALIIITIRPGLEDAVAQAQIDAASAVGYTRPPKLPCGEGQGCLFFSQEDLPQLSIVTYPAGRRISYYWTVPAEHTGVTISLA